MTLLKIVSYPDPKLKRKAKKVTTIDANIKKIIADMFETHYNTPNCAALAATQLDLIDPPHITVIDFSAKKNSPLCIINGLIIQKSGTQKNTEGCMSVYPDYIHSTVKRAETIIVEYMDQNGNIKQLEATGFMAKCIQHELDHLNGIIYLDHLSRIKRTLIESKIAKLT
jgi:peptide deformylase